MECLDNYLEDGACVMRNLSKGTDPAFAERLSQSVFGIQMQKDVIRNASLLNHAIFSEDLEMVKKLIRWGVSMDSADYNNIKPLDFAIARGNTNIIKFLMSVVAKTNRTGTSIGEIRNILIKLCGEPYDMLSGFPHQATTFGVSASSRLSQTFV
ncbi:unnamed protein product [Eruca vesicaria subsp. sativa]|uniref:Ankyrin repeat protein n=1 Tax=Eruca vesicaria subsp. sativa TaxID=29727 RepID=A0ABC8LXR1_ERUVS|nr:unnamed protein product [Eruca vesicaria subsp. sativa]